MSSVPPKLYEFMIKGINALSKETDFIGWKECLDFAFFPNKNVAVFAIRKSDSSAKIFTLDYEAYNSNNTRIKVPLLDDPQPLFK